MRKLLIILSAFALLAALLFGGYFYLSRDLPTISEIEEYTPSLATEVYDRDGNLLIRFGTERRIPAHYTEIPRYLVDAFVAMEDRRFWNHWGLDLRGIFRALLVDLRHMRMVQGASTITQQLARNMFLRPEKTLKRKLQEAILAIRLERTFSKEEILERYLNQIYFGYGIYGVKMAARFYFGKDLSELTLSECALLAAIPRSPALYSPFRNPERAEQRRRLVLKTMLKSGFISEEEYIQALREPPQLAPREEKRLGNVAPYFLEMVRQYVINKYGDEFLYRSGARIYTTLNGHLQQIANRTVDSLLQYYEETYNIQPKKADYVYDSLNPRPPDYLQAALVAMDPHTGEILALVGGRDFRESEFNRAVQAKRQVGSAFKPFVYAAALDNGWAPVDHILDAPLVVHMDNGQDWAPDNYDGRYLGSITLRKALALSRNLATARLALELGMSRVVEYARRMGVPGPIPPYPSIALGALSMSLLDLTRAYATIASYGERHKPIFITRITDAAGNLVEENRPEVEGVALDSVTTYILIDMMKSVLDEGTGRIARRVYGFRRPAAGKTGTTNEYRDTWFVGFTPQIIAGVWVGFDSLRTIMKDATGARMAVPIWAVFMREAHKGLPVQDFPEPSGVAWAEVCEESGLLATPRCPHPRWEVFREGEVPEAFCTLHTQPISPQEEFERLEREFFEKEEYRLP